MAEQPEQINHVTIIKRKKVIKADGHHGGAWKVAYADFVTAMMAFFLLMWLLNATTEQQRKGIADYFNPTIPISRISGGGSDGLNGSSIFTEETYAQMGTGASREKSVEGERNPEDGEKIAKDLQDLREQLSKDPQQLSEHLMVKMTAEGIVLEIIDSESRPLFEVGQSEPTDLLVNLLGLISGSLNSFDNDIKIVGHTDNRQFRNAGGYDNWNLSADRANTARKLLLGDGLPGERMREVSGRADTDPLIADNPSAAQNRRISITIVTTGDPAA
ncbi:flagellar motor protein MotB [Henriciella litoralis]|uniref:flagellar motor protein MotB n=1 Tax=Henriciella litoralis TaxID=568102 RepID=UPI0009FE35EC|nr:flagellar motor protein MotB [Henriciella litoralis]